MQTSDGFAPNLTYLKSLVVAGLDGISQARREARDSVFTPALGPVAWKSVAAGACAGALGARVTGSQKVPRLVLGVLVGTLAGLGAAVAWTSRSFTASAARSALQLVNAARDAHWLEANPIDYA
jgi:hypothetical protein